MKIKVNKQNVGLRIKQIRLNKGYTLEVFGKLFDGATKGNVQQWEQGRSLPNKERIKAIAKLGDMSVNELLYGSVEEFVKENYNQIAKTLTTKNIFLLEARVDYLINYLLPAEKINIDDIPKLISTIDETINQVPNDVEKFHKYLDYFVNKLEDDDMLLISELLISKLEKYTLTDEELSRVSFLKYYLDTYLKD